METKANAIKNDTKSDKLTNTTPIHEEGEAAKTTEEEIDEPTDELANESPTDYEYAPDNQIDGRAANTAKEEVEQVDNAPHHQPQHDQDCTTSPQTVCWDVEKPQMEHKIERKCNTL